VKPGIYLKDIRCISYLCLPLCPECIPQFTVKEVIIEKILTCEIGKPCSEINFNQSIQISLYYGYVVRKPCVTMEINIWIRQRESVSNKYMLEINARGIQESSPNILLIVMSNLWGTKRFPLLRWWYGSVLLRVKLHGNWNFEM
jgi:hypothetical protein